MKAGVGTCHGNFDGKARQGKSCLGKFMARQGKFVASFFFGKGYQKFLKRKFIFRKVNGFKGFLKIPRAFRTSDLPKKLRLSVILGSVRLGKLLKTEPVLERNYFALSICSNFLEKRS